MILGCVVLLVQLFCGGGPPGVPPPNGGELRSINQWGLRPAVRIDCGCAVRIDGGCAVRIDGGCAVRIDCK